MKPGMYEKEVECPICKSHFKTLKLKSNAVSVLKKDEDFCTHYKGENPMFYEIFVCPVCAYSASESSFNDLTVYEQKLLENAFEGRQVSRNYCGERNMADALDSFKLALLTAKIKKSKNSTIAGICLKIAWLYRMMESESEKEKQFMEFAFDNYVTAFGSENLPLGNLDEMTVFYLLGELARRLDKIDDAVLWFGKAMSSPLKKDNPRIENMAKDQWALVKEIYKAGKEQPKTKAKEPEKSGK